MVNPKKRKSKKYMPSEDEFDEVTTPVAESPSKKRKKSSSTTADHIREIKREPSESPTKSPSGSKISVKASLKRHLAETQGGASSTSSGSDHRDTGGRTAIKSLVPKIRRQHVVKAEVPSDDEVQSEDEAKSESVAQSEAEPKSESNAQSEDEGPSEDEAQSESEAQSEGVAERRRDKRHQPVVRRDFSDSEAEEGSDGDSPVAITPPETDSRPSSPEDLTLTPPRTKTFRYKPSDPEVVYKNKNQLFLEDVKGPDTELWLCRVPRDVELDVLHGKRVVPGCSFITHTSDSLEGIRCHWEVNVNNGSQESLAPTLVLPSKVDQRLHAVAFDGSEMAVTVTPQLDPYQPPEGGPKARVEMPKGLRVRHVPFGSEAPVTMKGIKQEDSKGHQKTHDSSSKKKKKKKDKKEKH